MATCPNCGVEVNEKHSHCFKCGKGIAGEDVDLNNLPLQPAMQEAVIGQKYEALSVIASCTKGFGWLLLIIGLLVILFSKGNFYEIMMGIYLITGCFGILMSAGIVHLLIDIEKNTRKELK